MGTPRRQKDSVDIALTAERDPQLAIFTKDLRISIVKKLCLDLDVKNCLELIKQSELEKQNLIRELKRRLYKAKPIIRRKPTTKKEKDLKERIKSAQVDLYRMMLLRAQITLLEATPGSINHSRNIIGIVLNGLINSFRTYPQKSEVKTSEDLRKFIDSLKLLMGNFKEQSWKFEYVFAECIYIYALTFRYAPATKKIGNFDSLLKEFQDCVISIRERTSAPSPEWIMELFDESSYWQIVQNSRRAAYLEEIDRKEMYKKEVSVDFLELQSLTPSEKVYVKVMIQYSFIQSYKLSNIEEANKYLDRINKYAIPPDLRVIWLLSKVYCQKVLGRQNDIDYKGNVTKLNMLIRNSGEFVRKTFNNEIEQLKKL